MQYYFITKEWLEKTAKNYLKKGGSVNLDTADYLKFINDDFLFENYILIFKGHQEYGEFLWVAKESFFEQTHLDEERQKAIDNLNRRILYTPNYGEIWDRNNYKEELENFGYGCLD